MDIKQLIKLGLDEDKAKDIFSKVEKYILDEVKKKTKEYEAKILDMKLNMVIERQLAIAGAKNIKATKALIDFDELRSKNIDENLVKNIIDELKKNEETKFLFYNKNDVSLKGFKPLESNVNKDMNNDLSYEQLCKYYERGIF